MTDLAYAGLMLNSSPQLNKKINQLSPDSRRQYPEDIKAWESELNDYRGLMLHESSIRRLKDIDISSLEKQILAQDGLLPPLAETAEKVCSLAPSGLTMSDVYMAGQRETARAQKGVEGACISAATCDQCFEASQ